LVNVSAAVSRSDRGAGSRYQVGFESRTPHLSYGAVAELISDDFVTVGNVAVGQPPPRLTLQAFAGLPLSFGSLGLSYILHDRRSQPDVELLGASASLRLGSWGMVYLTARKSLRGPANDMVMISLTKPLGASASASLAAQTGLDDLLRLSLQKNLPAGTGLGYGAALQLGAIDRFDGRLSYQTDFGTFGAELSWVDARTGVRMSASGGIGFMRKKVFASRKLTQSFATVKVGNYAGVRIYADNQQVGTTNASGVAVIPRLRPFERNEVRIEVADLPLDAQIDESEQSVRPYDRSGVAVEFGVKPAHGAIVTLVGADGKPLPAGASVRLNGSAEDFVVAPGGEAYLTGLGAASRGVATWQTGTCTFQVSYPESALPQPRLGPVECRGSGQ
jgi:outer membrane usher protein